MKTRAAKWQWVSLGLIAAGSLSGCAVHRPASPGREWCGPGLRRGPIVSTPADDSPIHANPETTPSTVPSPVILPSTPPAPLDVLPSTVPPAIPPASSDEVVPQEAPMQQVPLPPPPPPRQGAFSQFKSRLFPRKEQAPLSTDRSARNSRVASIDEDGRSERGRSRVRPVQYDGEDPASHDEASEGEGTLNERVLIRDRTHLPPSLHEAGENPFEPSRPAPSDGFSGIPAGFDTSADADDKVEAWPYHDVKTSLNGFSHAADGDEPPAYPYAPAPAARKRATMPAAAPALEAAPGSAKLSDDREDLEVTIFDEEPAFEQDPPPRGAELPGELEEDIEDETPAGTVKGLFPLPTIEPGPSYQRHRR